MTGKVSMDNLRPMARFFRFFFKMLATLFGILAVLGMIAAWRIATWAATSTDITPYIQSALSVFVPEVHAEIAQSRLTWDTKKQTLMLQCDGAKLSGPESRPVAAFETLLVKMRVGNIVRGRLIPQELVAHKAQLWLMRDKDGVISSGLHTGRSAVEKDVQGAVDFLFLQLIADEIADPNLRQKIDIKDVQVTVADTLSGQDWTVRIPDISLAHENRSSVGGAKIEIDTSQGASTLNADYMFDFDTKLHRVALDFDGIKPSTLAAQRFKLDALKIADFPVSGRVTFRTDRDLDIAQAEVSLDGGEGFLRDETLWDKPRAVQKIQVRAVYDKEKKSFEIPVAQIDFGGPKLGLTLQAKTPTPKDLIWLTNKLGQNAFTATITLDDVPMDAYASIWPKTIIPDARNWIANSLSKGVFTHGEVTVRGRVRLDDIENAVLESGGGKVEAKDGVVNYLDGMPAIENTNAEATFDLDHMDVKILSGNTGAIKVQPFTLVMDHFQEDVQYITIPVKLSGPVPQVLKVLDAPPLGYAKEIGLDPNDSSGTVEGMLTLHMPLLDALLIKDVEVKANAKISDFAAQKLVPQIGISAGAFTLDLTKDGFDLKGNAALNKVPAQIVWKSNFGVSDKPNLPLHDATITATLKGEQWGQFYGLDSLAKIRGETPTTIKYTNVKSGLSRVSGQVGLKQAAVQLKDIGWNKPAGEAAQLAFSLDIPQGKNLVFRSIDLQGQGVKVKGTAELDEATGQLIALNFKPFVLGRSNAEVSYLKPVDPSRPLSIRVEGEAFDMFGLEEDESVSSVDESGLPVKKTSDQDKNRPKDFTLKLTKLYTSEDGFLSSIAGHARRDAVGWQEIDLFGIAQGTNPLTIKLLPEGAGLKFSLVSDNFGAALQGMGFGSGVKGGEIEVWGESAADDPRAIQGKLKIGSFVVSDLPVLARLLSAVSPFGFVDLITGDANFDHLRGRYRWHGDDIDFTDVRAAGSVVGINLDGRINADTGDAHLNGTLVPFSFMNSILGAIPLLGDVITGGSGQGIIAASFTVKGNMSSPDVSVNPVSLLTPGFLRNLFFAGEDTKGEDKAGH